MPNPSSIYPQPDPAALPTLNALLHRNHEEFDVIRLRNRSSHMAHDLLTLYALGADAARLERSFNLIAAELKPRRPQERKITEANWEEGIGKNLFYTDYLLFFDEQLREMGGDVSRLLGKFLPRLLPGLLGSAIHPLIHPGFGAEFDRGEVASEGLAHAVLSYLPVDVLLYPPTVPVSITEAGPTPWREVIDALYADHKVANMPLRHTTPIEYAARIKEVIAHHGETLALLLQRWIPWPLTPGTASAAEVEGLVKSKSEELVVACHYVYASTALTSPIHSPDFFFAHTITGSHAVMQLLPTLDPLEQIKLLRLHFLSILLLIPGQGMPPLAAPGILEERAHALSENPPWATLVQKAIDNDDQHVCKVVRAALEAEHRFGPHDGLFTLVASITADWVGEHSNWTYSRRE